MKATRLLLGSIATLLGGLWPMGLALAQPPAYQITTVGLTDTEHTRNDNFRVSLVSASNAAGQAAGFSNRYEGGATFLGQTVWLYSGGVTTNIGLTDTEHTRNDNYRASQVSFLNAAGQVAGRSVRYNGGATSLGESVWLHSGGVTTNIGLTDTEHTRNDNFRLSEVSFLNAAGQVAGRSFRYNGGATSLGESVWLHSGGVTTNIGLTDTEHTSNTNYRFSQASFLNAAGQVAGRSDRYSGGATHLGQTAWLHSGGVTTNIGLTDAEHTRNDNYRFSLVSFLNAAGQVAGRTFRYNGGATFLGESAWLHSGGITTNIGLTDTEHTRNTNYRFSQASFLNAAGQVAGRSERYNGGATHLGQTAWLHSGGVTTNIGLTDTEHTRNDNYRFSDASFLNAAGQVAGRSDRYNGGATFLGQTAWLHSGGVTTNIGLTDAEHTRNDNYRFSLVSFLNGAGQVAGRTFRYNGGAADLGQTAWLHSGGVTTNIGLTDTEHTRNDNFRLSEVSFLNGAGQVAGRTFRYNGGAADLGQTAWLHSGGVTTNIGLTDTVHTRNDNFRFSDASFLNGAGQVAGFSRRYDGGATILGQTAWFYDAATDITHSFVFSTRSDGFAFSQILHLNDAGLALGYYRLFAPDDSLVGDRAFMFSLATGAWDLGSLVEGGLNAAGWSHLIQATGSADQGLIVGFGLLSDMTGGGQMPFLLTPAAIPEPGTLAFLAMAASSGGAVWWRRRRQRMLETLATSSCVDEAV